MRWHRLAESARRRGSYYLALYRHPRILPRPARWLLWAALGYLDDVLIVGGLLALVLLPDSSRRARGVPEGRAGEGS